MKRRKWIVAACLGALAVAGGAAAWRLTSAKEEAARVGGMTCSEEPAAPIRVTKPHLAPPGVLKLALARMHDDAVDYFHAAPYNGFSRMGPVYTKVLRDWNVPFFFSPGELENEEDAPLPKELATIHSASLRDFVEGPKDQEDLEREIGLDVFGRIGFGRMSREDWLKFSKGRKLWEVKQVDLVGILLRADPVVYESEHYDEWKKTGKAPIRAVDEFEMVGLNALAKGAPMFARAREGVIRMVGALRADASCLSCHEGKKEGDLLGAFSYVLREARYKGGDFGEAP